MINSSLQATRQRTARRKNQQRRADTALSRPHRRAQSRVERLHHHQRRNQPGPGTPGRCAAGRRQGAAAHRHPGRAEGHLLRQGLAHHLRLEDAGKLHRALRRACHHPVQRCRCGESGQDQHGRIRDGFQQRDLVFRCGEESVGPQCRARRQFRRRGLRGGGAAVRRRHRNRHRRLDTPAGRAVRHLRHQADLRHGVALRHDRVCLQPGSGRADGAQRGRPGIAAERDDRLRPARFHQPAARQGRLCARP